MVLPPEKFNSTHIAVESNGYGCDEHRSYILSNLALCGAESLECLICRQTLLIYDSFPLIDGLMFQSPESYVDQLTPTEYEPPYVSFTKLAEILLFLVQSQRRANVYSWNLCLVRRTERYPV